MDITTITLTQYAAWILSTLAGMILGSMVIPKPVRGGIFSILFGGILGAIVGAVLAQQLLFANIAVPDLRVLAFFFGGALLGVILVKVLLQETRRFRTESRS